MRNLQNFLQSKFAIPRVFARLEFPDSEYRKLIITLPFIA